MRRIAATALCLLMTLLIACGGEPPQPSATDSPLPPLPQANQGQSEGIQGLSQPQPDPNQARTGSNRTDSPMIDQAQMPTPTTVVRLNLETQTDTVRDQATASGGDRSDANETGSPTPATPTADAAPAARQPGQAVNPPQEPQFTDQVLVQDLYNQVNLRRYELNPANPDLHQEAKERNLVPYEEYRDHPYLHLFPSVQAQIREIKRTTEDVGREHPREFEHMLYDSALRSRDDSDYTPRYGIEHFLAHPWWEPIYETDLHRGTTSEPLTEVSHTYGDFNARYFGKNSTRQVLAEAVAQMLENARRPETVPLELPWGEKEPLRLTNPAPLEEYIKMAFAPADAEPNEDRHGIPYPAYMTPKAKWDFADPKLPIVHVQVYTRTVLPLQVEGDEETWVLSERLRQIRIPQTTTYSVHFIVAFQNRWQSFADWDRWPLRFAETMQPATTDSGQTKRWYADRRCSDRLCRWDVTQGALDPTLADRFPNYWHASDYMQHSIIGDVILTVHESPVLKEGTYSATPRITRWDAPGPVVPAEKLMAPYNPEIKSPTNYPILSRFPYPNRPNPGFPLPGHLLADAKSAPGSQIWEEWDLGPEWE